MHFAIFFKVRFECATTFLIIKTLYTLEKMHKSQNAGFVLILFTSF